ncbi:hypothetical protein FQ154_20305 [Paeniglutamicibacter gangotriensis]|uniref:Allophanate hydrolase C-terminal domain-containing protein n=1 Tax=Paeniglutamicibacter gangotriensis TaxID=254787 RepID=A0A5B0E2Y1_9MICC|nr:gamma-glutamylcyclotransferase [Paeniglutamicibacter gangotriensis]KAA0973026.1 hypothetical protein FQ154_20305 [Paeniglutamicibacter gangotriensis]
MENVKMFVNGQAMSGGSINGMLGRATFLGEASTAARYRFYSVRAEFPGLSPVESSGRSIRGELYEVSYDILRRSLLPAEPAELELTVIELNDGTGSLSMAIRREALNAPGVVDITDFGGWRNYLKTRPTK